MTRRPQASRPPRPCVISRSPLPDTGHRRAHGQASTDKLLKNHDCCGSRHNGGHKPLSPLILLMFSHQNIPCAMVLRFPPYSPRRPGVVASVACEWFRKLDASLGAASARFPKFVLHRSDPCHELRKAKGTRDSGCSSAAFDLKFLSQIRGNFRRNFKSAALVPHDFAVRSLRRSSLRPGRVHRIPPRVRDEASAPHTESGWRR